ncbi:hypothetical protein ROZALSC1DRAFT_24367 [Rozella allomycis CSF55]|uniref:Uncharacterized protein n=1 Tax=Rozella allomycis (strain CSF55) TaxID=988480 RepID=A0A4P9YDR1_ROZAC|nr:hypothetical protein ROZALSC1DRAFT_24367 [Rozella allomycis CSF55]
MTGRDDDKMRERHILYLMSTMTSYKRVSTDAKMKERYGQRTHGDVGRKFTELFKKYDVRIVRLSRIINYCILFPKKWGFNGYIFNALPKSQGLINEFPKIYIQEYPDDLMHSRYILRDSVGM